MSIKNLINILKKDSDIYRYHLPRLLAVEQLEMMSPTEREKSLDNYEKEFHSVLRKNEKALRKALPIIYTCSALRTALYKPADYHYSWCPYNSWVESVEKDL